MPSFAGIIYPNAFQMSDLIVSISQTFLNIPFSQPFRFFRYKNIELGTWNVSMSSNQKKTIWALIFGDIFNERELKKQLLDLGFHFQSNEIAELAVFAYEAWGTKFLEKLNGPFTLALFDEQTEELVLSLDRMGQKTLYWTFQGDHFLFATEIKALLASGIVPQNISNSSLSSYLYFGFIPQDYSAIENVNKLLPGHFIQIDLKRQMSIDQYWSLSGALRKRKIYTFEEATSEFGAVLESSIRKVAQEEERISTHLHNTLGSDIITWLLAHCKMRDSLDTFTPIFDEKKSPVLESASAFSKELSLRHHSKRISVDTALDELPRMIWYLDEPVADPSFLKTWQLGRFVQKANALLVLDLGWQELMAGHPHYFPDAKEHLSSSLAYTLAQTPPFVRDRLLFPLLRPFNSRFAFRILRNIDINQNQIAYLMHSALFKGHNRHKVSPFLYHYFDPEVFTQRFHHVENVLGDVHPSLYYDLKTALPNRHLLQCNRLLMPFGAKIYIPFLDNDVIDFSAALPDEVKFAKKVPAAVLNALWKRLTKKAPSDGDQLLMTPSWSNHPRLRKIFSNLTRGRLVEEGLISQKWIQEQCAPIELTDMGFRELWAILVLEIWFRLFINRPIGMQDYEVNTETLLGL